MKKLTLLAGISAILFFGCKKETANQPGSDSNATNNQEQNGSLRAVRIDANGKSSVMPVALPLQELQQHGTPVLNSLRTSNHSATGHFSLDGYTLSFSSVQNNGGTHGIINVSGQYAYQYSYQMQCTCLQVNGSDAIFGGIITSVQNNGGLPFVAVGNYSYWRVKDNGEGANSPADQVSDVTYFNPYSLCDLDLFQLDWLSLESVMPGGNVQVQ